MIKRPVYAVDFDRVIHDIDHPVPGMRMGPPIEGARVAVMKLYRKGTVIIHTVQATRGVGHIADWMRYYEIPYHEITAVKPNATYYIDDKAVRFENWEQTLAELK